MDKASLFEPAPDAEDTVPLRGGGEVTVRGLSRDEQLHAVKQDDVTAQGMPRFERTAIIESRIVAAGMVNPTMTPEEVRRWQKVPGKAADVNAVSIRIQELSGMLEDAPKSGVQAVPGAAGPGVRALPGGQAGDDGGPAADGDVSG